MSRLRELTVKTLLLSVGKTLSALTSLFITIVLTRSLSKEDFAAHKQVILLCAIFTSFIPLGLPKALYFFIPNDQSKARKIILEQWLIFTVISILLFGRVKQLL